MDGTLEKDGTFNFIGVTMTGDRIKKTRLLMGWTTQELGAQLGMTKQGISNLEKRGTNKPDQEQKINELYKKYAMMKAAVLRKEIHLLELEISMLYVF